MRITAKFLSAMETHLRRFLLKHVDVMPASFVKSLAWYYPYAPVRRAYLELLGVTMGEGTLSNVGLIPISGGSARAHIGRNVSIAPNVTLVLSSNPNNGKVLPTLKYVNKRLMKDEDIWIEDEAWIGTGVTIMPGVTVGYCAVIGAGCVLTRDADRYGIYVGVPGKKIGDVRQWEEDFVE